MGVCFMPRRDVGLLFTCEHGGNRIPRRWAALFEKHRALLDSHRGWDPGALTLARALSKATGAPLVASTTSRLLVDLNRSEHHRAVFSSITLALPDAERERIFDEFYRPYRSRVEQLVDAAIARGRVVHLSAHSFVPVLNGETRRADVALLYDPSRKPERAFCDAWLADLKAALPSLALRRNSPYRGSADGLTTTLRRRHAANDYIGVEIEVNQRLLGSGHFAAVKRALAGTLKALLR
jgi:predicted N-formylglutamate amidohydrolase